MPVAQILLSILVFFAVALPIYAIFAAPAPAEPALHRRIAAAVGSARVTVFEHALLGPVMYVGVMLARRIQIPALKKRVRQDLDAAGNPSGYAVEEYIAICLTSAVGLALAAGLLELLLRTGLSTITVPLMAALGFYAPLYALKDAARRRVARIAKQLPYTLDLVSLVMTAGSSFSEAVQTLVRDNPTDDLNQELQLALSEIEFGTPRASALANMARRIPLDSLRSVVGAINQADRLGTPLAEILGLQAEMLRMHRSVQAEKLSASASLRILVPSVLILMAVVVIVFAPLVIRFMEGKLM